MKHGIFAVAFLVLALVVIAVLPARSSLPYPGSIVFQSNRDGNAEIYIMNADGSDPKRLTFRPKTKDFQGELSPDGQHILWVSSLDMWIMTRTGQELTRVNPWVNGSLTEERGPQWHPNGLWFVMNSNHDSAGPELWIANARDPRLPVGAAMQCSRGRPRRSRGVFAQFPAPDPTSLVDTRKVGYNSNMRGKEESFVGDMTIDWVNNVCTLTNEQPISNGGSSWRLSFNSDGTWGVFARVGKRACPRDRDIWKKPLSGTIIENPDTNLSCTAAQQYAPVFSPGLGDILPDLFIAYTSEASGNRDIWVMDADGANPTQITTEPGDDSQPSWGP